MNKYGTLVRRCFDDRYEHLKSALHGFEYKSI
jgi:hypothetical protein